MSINGNPNIGVLAFVNNKLALVPPGITRSVRRALEEVLGVDVIETTIADTRIVGVFVSGNDRAVLLPHIVSPEELDALESAVGRSLRIAVIPSRKTALGNLIVANNKAAVVSSELEPGAVKSIEEALGVKVCVRRYSITPAIGSLTVANDSASLVHPGLSDEEIADIERCLGVRAGPATVNEGVAFVKSGVLLNNRGVLVGELTTGPEIMNIQSLLAD
ncbi:MAG: translation initiation factor IF-6 [Fervidicoccaceae archaeon]